MAKAITEAIIKTLNIVLVCVCSSTVSLRMKIGIEMLAYIPQKVLIHHCKVKAEVNSGKLSPPGNSIHNKVRFQYKLYTFLCTM